MFQCRKLKETRVCSGGVMMVQMARGADAILKLKLPQRPQTAGQKLRYINDKANYKNLYA